MLEFGGAKPARIVGCRLSTHVHDSPPVTPCGLHRGPECQVDSCNRASYTNTSRPRRRARPVPSPRRTAISVTAEPVAAHAQRLLDEGTVDIPHGLGVGSSQFNERARNSPTFGRVTEAPWRVGTLRVMGGSAG